MTNGPVNLNRYRKKKARAEKKARADQNAARHGLPKAERKAIQQENQKSDRELDGKVMQLPQFGAGSDPESP